MSEVGGGDCGGSRGSSERDGGLSGQNRDCSDQVVRGNSGEEADVI